MASKSVELSIPWPLAPDKVSSNRDRGFLHLIAMLTMVIDHVGVVIFPGVTILRWIGRLAMPIFAYCVACGVVYTKKPIKYLKRLVILALITQPVYAFTMNHMAPAMITVSFEQNPVQWALNFFTYSWLGHPSILFTLILGMLICWSLRERQIVFAIALAVITCLLKRNLDYGWKGVVLVVLFYVFCQKTWLSLPCVLAYMIWWGMGGSITIFGLKFNIQIFAVFALIPIYIHTNTRIRIPKWFNYAFYPAHMIILYLIKNFCM